nr:VanZ family protein [uncultured Arsenicibacter sp.]
MDVLNQLITRKNFWRLAILWTAIMFIGCAWPGNGMPSIDNFDKFEHLAIFALFAWLWLRAGRSVTWVLIAGVVYGMGIEVFQGAFPVLKRSFDLYDGVADAVGTILGILVAQIPVFKAADK